MTSLGASQESDTRNEIMTGLKYPKNYTNSDIAEGYKQLTQIYDQNENLFIGKCIGTDGWGGKF